jgi:type IV secretion system protein VirB5
MSTAINQNTPTETRSLSDIEKLTEKLLAALKDTNNQYINARREWNERYGSYIKRARNWQLAFFGSLLITLAAVIGCIYIGSTSKFIPYIVEVDKLGKVISVSFADQAGPVESRYIREKLIGFITDTRSVIRDTIAQKKAIERVYSTLATGTAALNKINEHFRANDPFKIAQEGKAITAEVFIALAVSDKTWQLEWRENVVNAQGAVISATRWKGSFTVAIEPPQEQDVITHNPFGLYVVDFNWTPQL